MKKSGFIFLATLLGFTASSAYASNVATSTMGATLVNAISIANNTGLNFGYIVQGATMGTVVVPAVASPTRTATGGIGLGNVGATSSASFTVTGVANATYAITLPSSVTIYDGGYSMIVNTFASLPASTGTLSGTGSQTMYVGATVNVGGNQPFLTGFSGTFNVIVAYN